MSDATQHNAIVKELNGQKVVVVETMNGSIIIGQDAVKQGDENKKRIWRPLSRFTYPTQDFSHDFTNNFPAHLIFHLHRTFRDAGYTEFTSLIKIETFTQGNVSGQAIQLVSQHAKYIGGMFAGVKKLWDVAQDRAALQNEQNAELMHLQKNWSVFVNLLPIAGTVPYRFVHDTEGLQILITPIQERSTDPGDYPDKVSRTSELLTFMTAYANARIAVANLDVVSKYFPLSKLMFEIFDHEGFDLEKVRIDASDPERWDYINPSADIELAEWSERLRQAKGTCC
jgi:hypothetical protein